jgi:hypothetical protein
MQRCRLSCLLQYALVALMLDGEVGSDDHLTSIKVWQRCFNEARWLTYHLPSMRVSDLDMARDCRWRLIA